MAENGEWDVTSLEAVAQFFGARYQTVRREWKRRGMPGGSGRYPLDEIARWLFADLADKSKPQSTPDDGSRELRQTRSKLAKLELEQKQGALVDAEVMQESLRLLTGLMRGAGSRLQKQYGADAQDILTETLEDWERLIDEMFDDEGRRE